MVASDFFALLFQCWAHSKNKNNLLVSLPVVRQVFSFLQFPLVWYSLTFLNNKKSNNFLNCKMNYLYIIGCSFLQVLQTLSLSLSLSLNQTFWIYRWVVPCFLLRLFDSLLKIRDHQCHLISAPILTSVFVTSPPRMKFDTPTSSD